MESIAGNEPVSPIGQYFNSSALSISIICALEFEIPIDDLGTMSKTLLKDIFLPINPRFSSIMVTDDHGVKHWKRVNVKIEDHIHQPYFASGLSPEAYEAHLQQYLTDMAMLKLPQCRPLWEIHIFKYPTTNAAGTLLFKLHHSLGDGFSLMSALFSCLQRARDPSLPITFPSIQLQGDDTKNNIYKFVPNVLSMVWNSTADFVCSILKSSVVVDDETPIRSATENVECLPITMSTITFSLESIRQVKAKLEGTVNDVLVGTIFYGTRLYMQASSNGSGNAQSTALVLLNTRIISTYTTLQDMVKPDAESPWGNQFGFLHVSLPGYDDMETADPLGFVYDAKKTIKNKKSSLAVFLTGILLETMRKIRGPEATARYIHNTLRNTSMTVSNMIGPTEQIALANHPCKGIYFMVAAVPQSLTITMVSYMGKVRVAVGAEKGYINHQLFNTCLEKAFERIFNAAITS